MTNDSHRVLQGLSRVLVGRGHDETHDPVAAKPTWRGSAEVSASAAPPTSCTARALSG